MLFTIALFFSVLFACFCKKPLKKHPIPFYIAAAVLSLGVSLLDFSQWPKFLTTYLTPLFTRGTFAMGIWWVVMFTGALPQGKLKKHWTSIRGELSIFAAILTLGHNIAFGKTYFVGLFTDTASMSALQILAAILTLIMLAIMIPLTVMSFPKVRKKMKARVWKSWQRLAYVYYALLYVHIMLVFWPSMAAGRLSYLISGFVYSFFFAVYAVCRIQKALCKKRENTKGFTRSVLSVVLAFAILIPLFFLVFPGKVDPSPVLGKVSDLVYTDGTYTATREGFDGDITVTVTVEGGKLVDIKADTTESDPWFLEQVTDALPEQILAQQNAEVDVVSGATYSSTGFLNAMEEILQQAQ